MSYSDVPRSSIPDCAQQHLRGCFLAAQKPPGKTRGYVDWILALHRRFGVSRALVTHGSAVMDRVMMMVVMLQTSRPGGGAGKGVCWDTRNANDR